MAVSNDELADAEPGKITWAHLGIIWPTKLSLVVLCVLEDTVSRWQSLLFGPRPPCGDNGFACSRADWVMILPRDQFQLAIEEHDFMHPCDSVGRRNILMHDIEPLDWSEIPEVSASLVKPGLSNASELRSFGLMVRPHELREDPVIIRCLHQQYPLFDNCHGIVALENVFVEHIRPLILVADEETVIYQHSSSKSNELVVFD